MTKKGDRWAIIFPFRNKTIAASPINTTIQQYSLSFWTFDVLKLGFSHHLQFSAMDLKVLYLHVFQKTPGKKSDSSPRPCSKMPHHLELGTQGGDGDGTAKRVRQLRHFKLASVISILFSQPQGQHQFSDIFWGLSFLRLLLLRLLLMQWFWHLRAPMALQGIILG